MKKRIKKILIAALCGVLLLPVIPQTSLHTVYADTIAENAIYVAPGALGTGSENDPMDHLPSTTL